MRRSWRLVILLTLVLLGGITAPQPATQASPALQSPRELTVLAGAGQDTVNAFAYFPSTVQIRAGDMVTWKINGDSPHTISFTQGFVPEGATRDNSFGIPGAVITAPSIPAPGAEPGVAMRHPLELFPTRAAGAPVETYRGTGYVNSGRLRVEPWVPGVLGLPSFSLLFDTPGLYSYVCLIHPEGMAGIVEVLPASATNVPDQAAIDAQAQAEMAEILRLSERAHTAGSTARSMPGPHDTTLWSVKAGNSQHQVNDFRVNLEEFLPKDLTVQAGDTVVWESVRGHTVTFLPAPPAPEWAPIAFGPDGLPRLLQLPSLADPSRPSAVYDPTQFFNSGNMNTAPRGGFWSLTFETPGTFEYLCLIHQELGMKGTITVLPS
jgi:plastocyanin